MAAALSFLSILVYSPNCLDNTVWTGPNNLEKLARSKQATSTAPTATILAPDQRVIIVRVIIMFILRAIRG